MKIKKISVIIVLILLTMTIGCYEKPVLKSDNTVVSASKDIAAYDSTAEASKASPSEEVIKNSQTPEVKAGQTPEIKAAQTKTVKDEQTPEVKTVPAQEPGEGALKRGTFKLLEGKVICVDPGHGNPNHPVVNEPIAPNSDILKPATAYGTVGVSTKIPEYKLVMAVSLKIRDLLYNHGATVVMTRESNDVDLGMIERSEIGNKAVADIAVRIHADGFDNPSVSGASVLYPGSRYISDTELLNKSKAAAKYTLDELVKITGAKSRGIIERNDLTGFNWTRVPVILVETGFMTNPEEDNRLNSEEYQQKIAEGIVNGIIKYFKQ